MPRVTLSEYAKHRGCWPHAVEEAIRTGRIERGADGLIEQEQADAAWGKNTNSVKAAASKQNGARAQEIRRALKGEKSPEPSPPAEGKTLAEVFAAEHDRKSAEQQSAPQSESAALINFSKSRAEREHWAALRAKFDLEVRQGKYIDIEDAKRCAEDFYSRLKAALLSIPARIADELAAEPDRDSVNARLYAEIESVLTRHAGEAEEKLPESWGGVRCR